MLLKPTRKQISGIPVTGGECANPPAARRGFGGAKYSRQRLERVTANRTAI
jgi:hypothetical protein